MGERLNSIRILGLPLQFVVVLATSVALTIYIGAWAADARVEARNQEFSLSSVHSLYVQSYSPGGLYTPGASDSTNQGQSAQTHAFPEGEAEGATWEKAFLFACPLH